MLTPIRPEDVVNKMFSTTRVRSGYDREAVDALLDQVVAAMRSRRPLRSLLDGRDLPKSRPGYDTDEVDDFLEALLEQDETVERDETEPPAADSTEKLPPHRSPWVLGDDTPAWEEDRPQRPVTSS